jgi:hypothetical protein
MIVLPLIHQFDELIRLALYGIGRPSIVIAGVSFELAGDSLVYDVPVEQWNSEWFATELTPLVEQGWKRAKAIMTNK